MIGWFPLARLQARGLGGEGIQIDGTYHPIIVNNLTYPYKAGVGGEGMRFMRFVCFVEHFALTSRRINDVHLN